MLPFFVRICCGGILLLFVSNALSQSVPELIVQTGHSNLINSVAFSPDCELLVSGSDDGTVKIWDVATGVELRTINAGTAVWRVYFNTDGTVSGISHKLKTTWDVTSGTKLSSEASDVDTEPDQSKVETPDGKFSAFGGWMSNDVLLRHASGRKFELKGHTEPVIALAFSTDATVLASAGSDITIRLWNVLDGKPIRVLSGHSDSVISMAMSPSHPMVAIGSGLMEGAEQTDTIKVWSLNSGSLQKTFVGTQKDIASLRFSPDGNFIASRDRKGINVWNVSAGKFVGTFPRRSFYAFNAQSNALQLAEYDGEDGDEPERTKVEFWDLTTPKLLTRRTIRGSDPAGFSPDGRLLLSKDLRIGQLYTDTEPKTDPGVSLRLLDLSTNRSSPRILTQTDISNMDDVAFSSNGKVLAAREQRNVTLWRLDAGRKLGSFECEEPFAVNHDASLLACRLGLNGLRIWDSAKHTKMENQSAHSNTLRTVAFIGDGKFLASGSIDTKLKLWDPETGKELASLIAIDKEGWAVVTPDGRFDASTDAMELMYWRVNNEVIALSQLKERYYEPGLLSKVTQFNAQAFRNISAFRDVKLYPDVVYQAPPANSTKLEIKLTNRGGGIGPVQVFINGKEAIVDARPANFDPSQTQANISVDLRDSPFNPGQLNKLRVVAWNYDALTTKGNISSRGQELDWVAGGKADTNPTKLYAIVGGISDYEGSQIDLRFASKDAEDFAKALEIGARELFGVAQVHLTLLNTGTDKRALSPTKDNFRSAFAKARDAGPDDVFLVYLAGHGITLGQNTDTYLYLTREARTNDRSVFSDAAVRSQTAINSEELIDWVRQVRAKKQVLILDTCAAGSLAAKFLEKREVPGDQIRAIERFKDRTGFHILMGSAADSISYEASQYGQGLLTYTLLQGIKGAALKPDGQIDVSQLFNYAADEVPRLARNVGGIQKPEIKIPSGGASFAVGLIKEESKKDIPLSAIKPIVLRPRLQNRDLGYDNLGLEVALKQLLRDASYVTAYGGEVSPVVYIETDEMPGALIPSGNYTIVGGSVKVRMNLVLNGRVVKNFLISTNQSDREGLVKRITDAVIAAAATVQ